MKKFIYMLILPLLVVGGLVFANREINNDNLKKSIPKPLSAAEIKAAKKQWEASPDGIMFNKWKASPVGKKVQASASKIMKSIRDSTNMEAVITSLSLPPGTRLGFAAMVNINDDDYILSIGVDNSKELKQLQSLKLNDKIIIRSHAVSQAPKYSYPIVNVNYVERDGKIIYKRIPRKGGC